MCDAQLMMQMMLPMQYMMVEIQEGIQGLAKVLSQQWLILLRASGLCTPKQSIVNKLTIIYNKKTKSPFLPSNRASS